MQKLEITETIKQSSGIACLRFQQWLACQ